MWYRLGHISWAFSSIEFVDDNLVLYRDKKKKSEILLIKQLAYEVDAGV